MISAFPLQWPIGQTRVPAPKRQHSRFQVTMVPTRKDLLAELARLGAKEVVISSNLELRRDGLPYADFREPTDPGVAVYFERVTKGAQLGLATARPFVIACDSYLKAVHNLRAVGMTVSALRTIQRHGASSMLEQAFTGFAALPQAGYVKPWWEVLGVDVDATNGEVRAAYLELVRIHHPDAGGDTARMAEINAAWEVANGGRK